LCDLLGAALLAGEPVESALEVVAGAVATPWARPLLLRARAVLAGAAVETTDGRSGTLLRALRRSGTSGAKLAAQLRLSADDLRAEEASAALERAVRVGVHGVLPLGLCCLPAFMLLAVVPLAAGLVSGLR
jgi:pilus assembly protein TadC